MLAKDLKCMNELFSLCVDSWAVPREFYTIYQTNSPDLFLKVFDDGRESPEIIGRAELQQYLDCSDNEDEIEELSIDEVKALADNGFDVTEIITGLLIYTGAVTYGEEE